MAHFAFNFNKDNFKIVANTIKKNPLNTQFEFQTHYDGKNISYGQGATRSVLKVLFAEMSSSIFKMQDIHTITLNSEHEFWSDPQCGFVIANLLVQANRASFVIPWHLPLSLLEFISGKTLSSEELAEHMKRTFPFEYKMASGLDVSQFAECDIEYASHDEFYRSKLIFESKDVLDVYKNIATCLSLYTNLSGNSLAKIDDDLSGPYDLNPEAICSWFHFVNNTDRETGEIKRKWDRMVASLNKEQMQTFIFTLTSSSNLNSWFTIKLIPEDQSKNTAACVIKTCFLAMDLCVNVFDSDETLSALASYLCGGDCVISEEGISNDTAPNADGEIFEVDQQIAQGIINNIGGFADIIEALLHQQGPAPVPMPNFANLIIPQNINRQPQQYIYREIPISPDFVVQRVPTQQTAPTQQNQMDIDTDPATAQLIMSMMMEDIGLYERDIVESDSDDQPLEEVE
jgi:hypothetical protein